MAERTCGWCGVDISAKKSIALLYCCLQHKKNAGSKRHRERNPTYYRDMAKQPKRAAYLKAYAEANRQRARTYAREQQRRYRAEHPDHAARWWAANQDRHRLYQAARRFRTNEGPGVSLRDWNRLIGRYDGRCAYCGVKPELVHMDHIIPLKRGGRHSIGNVLPACRSCNTSKSARLLYEWNVSVLLTIEARRLMALAS
jgi:5-methylcytosine-specific restriction endonuclease McrA